MGLKAIGLWALNILSDGLRPRGRLKASGVGDDELLFLQILPADGASQESFETGFGIHRSGPGL